MKKRVFEVAKGILVFILPMILVCSFPFITLNRTTPTQEEVGICHKCGQEWIYKLIKESALQGHLQHGDFLYKGRPDVIEEEMTDWCNINGETK